MNLLIRADASMEIGTGHVMRSLALAQGWRGTGGGVSFVCHCESDALQKRILDEGFGLTEIKRPHPDPCDLEKVLGFFRKAGPGDGSGPPWLVLDGYHFDPAYQKASRDAGFKVLVIDDYNHQTHYHADILLNQNIKAESLEYMCDQDTLLLLGTKYALIRNEFLRREKKIQEFPMVARKVLVTLGGADPDNIVLKVVQALKLLDIKGLEVKIVVGPANPHLEQIEKEIQGVRSLPQGFQIVQNGDMPGLMAWADIAVSAGGITCWELAFMGVPFLVLILAENQEGIARGLGKTETAMNCGWFHKLSVKYLAECLDKMIADDNRRAEYSKRGRRLVDGLGTDRIIDHMAVL